MDPRDRLRPIPAGAACTACGAPVPSSEIRILARRDDVAFVELACGSCGSEALALLIAGTGPDAEPVLDVADRSESYEASRIPVESIRAAEARAVAAHLEAWQGDLVGWLDAVAPQDRRSAGGSVADT
jgi:hypothetical protein